MSVTINREKREAYVYRPVGTGFKLAAGLTERGWTLTCQKWNPESDLLHINVPAAKADEDLAKDIEAILPDEDVELSIG